MRKIICLIALLLIAACDDCSKPTKKVCEYYYPIIVPISTGKSAVMSTIMTCGKFVEVPNECYKGEKK